MADLKEGGKMKKIMNGTSYIQLDTSPVDETECVIEMVWVDPQDRGQGIGKHLVEMGIDYARAAGYTQVGLYAEPQDDDGSNGMSTDALIEFYRSLGFESGESDNQLMSYSL